MGRTWKYTEEQIERATDLRANHNMLIREIAEETGMSIGAVNYYCIRDGADVYKPTKCRAELTEPDPRRRGNHVYRRFTADESRLVVALTANGVRNSEIARRLGRAHNSITSHKMILARREERKIGNG